VPVPHIDRIRDESRMAVGEAHHRVSDKMWSLLERVREDEEMRGVTDRDRAREIDAALEEARKFRY
jgi:hypothetical protein